MSPRSVPSAVVESVGGAVALLLAVLAVWHIVATPRAWFLFSDADSVLPLLLRSSLRVGQTQDWATSAVLFAPEALLYLLITVVVPSGRAALVVNAVVNLLLVYGVLRLGAGVLASSRRTAVVAATAAFAAFAALTTLDSSAAWDAPELPSLIGMTTYYSATLVAALALPAAIVVASRGSGRRLVPLAALCAVSTWTNPLFVLWGIAPTGIVLALVAGRRLIDRRTTTRVTVTVLGAALLGWVARIPMSGHIATDVGSYLDPGRAVQVLFGYYGRLALEQVGDPLGALSFGVTCAMTVLCIVLYGRAVRAGDRAGALLTGIGWVTGPVVLLGAVVAGVPAYRYLQPAVAAPLLGLLVLLARAGLPRLRPRRVVVRALVAAAVALGITAVSGTATAAAARDRSLDCVTSWVNGSGRVGAGRFMTVRAPKASIADPRRLIQVTDHFRGWAWLVNRDDFRTRAVSFVVSDETSAAPELPAAAASEQPSIVRCGRYTITDFHRPILEIGSPTSRYDP